MPKNTKRLSIKAIEFIKKPMGLLPKNYKNKYNKMLDLLSVSEMEMNLKRVSTIKDYKIRLAAARELIRKYPRDPMPHLALAQCLHVLSDPKEFEQLDRYAAVRQEWLTQTGLDELDVEFIWPGMVAGSLGNHFAIESLLKANQVELRPTKKPVLLLPKNMRLRNPALFEYFEPHLCVIKDEEAIQALRKLESVLTLPLGLCLPMNDGCHELELAANRVEIEREKQGLTSALFQLSDRHREMGAQTLRRLGLPEDAWYVTLHVREPGYRGETKENTTENHRNANPLDYLKAIKAVTNAGGWVFRMGDPSMTPLPSIPQLIDYAHHEIRSDWMDVFLGATCMFCIATSSGYIKIPSLFGVPVLLTNLTMTIQFYNLFNLDLFLPRLLKRKSNNCYLTFRELMSPPTSTIWKVERFEKIGLQWVENTPDELEAATKEMIEQTVKSKKKKYANDSLQKRFKAIADACGKNYGNYHYKAFVTLSRDFLTRHADLIEGSELN